MKSKHEVGAVLLAVLAAVFYAFNVPFSKLLLNDIPPTFMAAFLYLGAGVGIGIIYLFRVKKEDPAVRLTCADLPYTVAMILLDILAPILLMVGIKLGSAANASLLGNFEIVATSVIALLIYRERVSTRLWAAIALITVSGVILSFDGTDSLRFSVGSLFVLLATMCWGFENNCTRRIADKSTYEIVLVKGLCSGGGSLAIAFILGETFPSPLSILPALLLGFVAYGLSIFVYIRAQDRIGAVKTSAYYALAPFIGSLLSFTVNGDKLSVTYGIALGVMIAGTVLVVRDSIHT